jgi:hypothetical protein
MLQSNGPLSINWLLSSGELDTHNRYSIGMKSSVLHYASARV